MRNYAGHRLAPWLAHVMVSRQETARQLLTPGEVMRAREHGFLLQKLFPAVQAGGAALLRALAAPLPDVRFCPTGGLTPDNLASFLGLPNVAMAGGSWLTPADALATGDWHRITRLAREATALSRTP